MRLLSFALAALLLTGCATSRQPASPLPAVTLGEVNRALEGSVARVHFADGRAPLQGRVTVGPEVTVVRNGTRVDTLPTEDIETVTMDVSMSPEVGAMHGAGVGATPGLIFAALVGLEGGFADNAIARHALRFGVTLASIGAGIGGGIGAATSTGRDDQVIYEAPVTRYPDAALVLLRTESRPETASAR